MLKIIGGINRIREKFSMMSNDDKSYEMSIKRRNYNDYKSELENYMEMVYGREIDESVRILFDFMIQYRVVRSERYEDKLKYLENYERVIEYTRKRIENMKMVEEYVRKVEEFFV